AAAGALGVRIVEHEPLREHVRVVIEHRAVQKQQTLLVDVDLRALGTVEHLVARPRLLVPRERVAQPRAAAAFDADTQSALADALLGHQRADLARGGFSNLNHFLLCAGAPPPAPVPSPLTRLGIGFGDFPLSAALRRWLSGFLRRLAGRGLLLLVVADRRLDRVLGEDRAVNLYRRQAQLADDVGVLDGERFVDRLALEPLGRQARARDRRPAPEALELGVVDDAGRRIDLHLQLHDIAALGRADQAR